MKKFCSTLVMFTLLNTTLAITLENAKHSIQYTTQLAWSNPPKIHVYGVPETICGPKDQFYEATVLALVADYASVFENDEESCGAHPAMNRTYKTLDLRNGKTVSLRNFFDEAVLLKALKQDKYIRSSIIGKSPKSLRGLEDIFSGNSDNCSALREETLSQFAFYDYDVQKKLVAVRLSLPYQTYACNEGFTQIGLWLPAPPTLQSAFSDALRHKRLGHYLKDKLPLKFRLN